MTKLGACINVTCSFFGQKVSSDNNVLCIAKELQQAVDDLFHWSRKWGMGVNVGKSKVLLSGDSNDDVIQLQMYDNKIEQVSKKKNLGVWLDQQLNFSLQVDYASPCLTFSVTINNAWVVLLFLRYAN